MFNTVFCRALSAGSGDQQGTFSPASSVSITLTAQPSSDGVSLRLEAELEQPLPHSDLSRQGGVPELSEDAGGLCSRFSGLFSRRCHRMHLLEDLCACRNSLHSRLRLLSTKRATSPDSAAPLIMSAKLLACCWGKALEASQRDPSDTGSKCE